MLGVGISAGLLEETVTWRACGSFAAPELIPVSETVCIDASWLIVRFASGSSVGGLFTTTPKDLLTELLLSCPSFTVTVMVAVPHVFTSGVTVSAPVAFGER